MATIHMYDVQEDEKAILANGLVGHACTFYDAPISLNTVSEDAEVISVFVSSYVTKAMLDMMPNLKLIACRSAGYNNIAIHEAERRGIHVVVVPSYGEHTVAEYAFALLLTLARKVPESVKTLKENIAFEPKSIRGVDLYGKKLGVIGTGKIGKKMISLARGFGMDVIAYDMYENKDDAHNLGFMYVTKEDLFRQSDVISLHAPLTPDTARILNEQAFALMKNNVYIINTARGELIDTHALLVALNNSKIAGVGLDVVEGEELVKERSTMIEGYSRESTKLLEESFYITSLLKDDRVILTPHIAYNTFEAVSRIMETTVHNIQNYFNGNISNKVTVPPPPLGRLILIRHTQSEWNEKGVWTGTRDAKLTQKGFEDARLLGNIIRDINIDRAYVSMQIRTMETLSSLLGTIQQPTVPITQDPALNERDYGEYTGKNKHDMKELLGQEMFDKVRRGWNVPIPNGETLENVYNRITPYFKEVILPQLKNGENILIVSHGNALRALMKYIENISDEGIEGTEMMFGGAIVYSLTEDGHMKNKEIRETSSMSLDTHV
jgi:D-lactate dehydrogenase